MTDDELRGLALRLAKEAGWYNPNDLAGHFEHLVRAAVVHGLRMGAEVCDGIYSVRPWQAGDDCAAALRAKADEMEQSK